MALVATSSLANAYNIIHEKNINNCIHIRNIHGYIHIRVSMRTSSQHASANLAEGYEEA